MPTGREPEGRARWAGRDLRGDVLLDGRVDGHGPCGRRRGSWLDLPTDRHRSLGRCRRSRRCGVPRCPLGRRRRARAPGERGQQHGDHRPPCCAARSAVVLHQTSPDHQRLGSRGSERDTEQTFPKDGSHWSPSVLRVVRSVGLPPDHGGRATVVMVTGERRRSSLAVEILAPGGRVRGSSGVCPSRLVVGLRLILGQIGERSGQLGELPAAGRARALFRRGGATRTLRNKMSPTRADNVPRHGKCSFG